MVIHLKYRSLRLILISSLLIWALYITISKIQDPSDFNRVIYPVHLNLTSFNPHLAPEQDSALDPDSYYRAHLLPVLEQNYQEQVVKMRKLSFIANSRQLSSFATTNANFWWTYFPSLNSWCPHQIERIGGVLWNWKWRGEGGKWLCGLNLFESISQQRPCIIYSYGIEDDTSFESAFLQRTKHKHCQLYMFDPTIDGKSTSVQALLEQYPNRAFFHRIGLSYENMIISTKGTYRTLKSEMDLHNHKFIDILKVDIEGNEFPTFRHIIDKEFRNQQSLPFGQLQIEIHLPSLGKEKLRLYYQFQEWYEQLEASGLRAFYSEPNPISAIEANDHVRYYEYSFVNVKTSHFILENFTLPFTR